MEDQKKHEIEKFAWQIFLEKSGLSFRRELTAEVKKKILDTEGNEWYREQALKMLEKKERAVLNRKYPVINVPADGKRSWYGGAYVLCFVYSKYNGNFVLKGYIREVEEYLKKNYTHYFYNMSLWSNGSSRDIWHFWKNDVGIFEVSIKERKKGKKTTVRPYTTRFDGEAVKYAGKELLAKTFTFKRLPKKWIPEFDTL